MADSAVFKKLQLKDQTEIVVLDAPSSFESEIKALKDVRVLREFGGKGVEFALGFVKTQLELDRFVRGLKKLAAGDAAV